MPQHNSRARFLRSILDVLMRAVWWFTVAISAAVLLSNVRELVWGAS